MKHLKLFENFYQYIQSTEYHSITMNPTGNYLVNQDCDTLSNLFPDYKFVMQSLADESFIKVLDYRGMYICAIFECEDEWFYVSSLKKYAKCDQWDGVYEFIRKELSQNDWSRATGKSTLRVNEQSGSTYYEQLPFLAIDQILYDEFMEIKDSALSYTPSEISTISREFTRLAYNINPTINFSITTKPRYRLNLYSSSKEIVQIMIDINNDDIRRTIKKPEFLCIYKTDDDWYYVSTLGGYGDFKCDQLEGLYKLIEDTIKLTVVNEGFFFNKKKSEPGYKEVDHAEWSKDSNMKSDRFSEYEVNEINKLLDKKKTIVRSNTWSAEIVIKTNVRDPELHITSMEKYTDKTKVFHIYKSVDEWYHVIISYPDPSDVVAGFMRPIKIRDRKVKYYVCDQFYTLQELISDNI